MKKILVCLLALIGVSQSKIFDRCELVSQLEKFGVPERVIPTLVCIAEWESGYDSGKINYKTGKHGIFQINEKVWCSPYEFPGRECETTCSRFRDDHLGDDVRCALKIIHDTRQLSGIGYDSWESYWEHCAYGNNLEFVKYCE